MVNHHNVFYVRWQLTSSIDAIALCWVKEGAADVAAASTSDARLGLAAPMSVPSDVCDMHTAEHGDRTTRGAQNEAKEDDPPEPEVGIESIVLDASDPDEGRALYWERYARVTAKFMDELRDGWCQHCRWPMVESNL